MRGCFAALWLVAGAGCATTSTGYLAKVNDETITGKELRQEFARHHYAMEKILGEEKDVRKYLERLVDRRLFVQEGYRMGLQDAPEVKEAVARVRGQKMVEAFLQDEIEARSRPTEDEVKAIHERLTEQLQVRQIVVETKEEAEKLRAAVVGGADCEALARERSVAESAKRGGLMVIGWGGDEAYEATLFAVKTGEVSPVFKSAAGWEVVRVEERKAVKRPDYDKVAGKIRQVLHGRKRVAREQELYAALWTKYEARVVDCAGTVDALRRAAGGKEGEGEKPCATWQGGTITEAALAKRVKIDQLGAAGDRWPELRKALVEDLVNREVVQREAEAKGYALRPEIVEKVKAQQDDLVEGKLYREHVIKAVEATPADARAFYDRHRDLFTDDAQLELAQIVVETDEVARNVEEKIRSRQPFAELAAAHSKDVRSAQAGGRVGFVERKALTGVFAPVAALGEGEVSAPITSPAGVHVVKVLSVKPERQRAFEDVADQARALALEEKQRAETQRWVGTLRAAGRVELNDGGIRAYEKERIALLRQEEQEKQAEAQRKAEATRKDADAAAAAAPAKPVQAPPGAGGEAHHQVPAAGAEPAPVPASAAPAAPSRAAPAG